MKAHLLPIFIFTFVFSASGFAQGEPSRRSAVLVDQIGGKLLPVRSIKVASGNGSRSISANVLVDVEARIFELINAERQVKGLPILAWDEDLADLARMHSSNMAENGFFSHRDPKGATVDQRAKNLGINWIAIGENIAAMRGHDDPGAAAVEKWLASSPHKGNLLSGKWRSSAIGAVRSADGTVYLTQVFVLR